MKPRVYDTLSEVIRSRCHPPSSPMLGRQRGQDALRRPSSVPARPGSSFDELESEFQRKVAEDDRRCLLPRAQQVGVPARYDRVQRAYERFEREQEARKRKREAREFATAQRRQKKAEERRLARLPKPKHVWRDGPPEVEKGQPWLHHKIDCSAVDPVVWTDRERADRVARYAGTPIFHEGFEHLPKEVREAVDLAFVADNAEREDDAGGYLSYMGAAHYLDRVRKRRSGERLRRGNQDESQRA